MRAALFYLAGLAVLYFGGAFSFFAAQRAVGKPLSLRQVVWPPAWKEYPQVQSRYFFEKARSALAAKAINEAIINLSLAYQLDSRNYVAGFTLAQLCQIGQPMLTDQIYAQLAREHPTERPQTLVAWYQALLLRGDFKTIRTLAAEGLRSDEPVRASSWLHALIFAQRCEPDTATLAQLVADPKIPPQTRDILALELRTQTLPPAETRLILLRPPGIGASPYFDYYRVRRLVDLGFPEDALALLGDPAARLGSNDRRAFWLDAHARMGWTETDRREVMAILTGSFEANTIVLLSAHLIRHPDVKLTESLFSLLRQRPLPANDTNYATAIALLCAAGSNDDATALKDATATVRQIAGNRFRTLDDVVAFFRTRDINARIEAHLPALQPQPIEITYALLQRFHRTTTDAK
jgi:hypothetical protein